MTHEEFNIFCGSLISTTYVMQWGGSHVWKIGGKVFAIGNDLKAKPAFTFKVTPMSFEILSKQSGLRPAPYLAARGFTWIQSFTKKGLLNSGLSDDELKLYFRHSHKIVSLGLSKKMQRELGINHEI